MVMETSVQSGRFNRPPTNLNKNRRVLVVDDNQAIHDDFRKILAGDDGASELAREAAELFGSAPGGPMQGDFDMSFALQGAEALELVKTAVAEGRRYSLVFTDMRMPPGWDGLETAQRLWEVDPDLQIVICTAYSDKSWDEMTEKLGNPERVLILKKPFDTIEVLQLAHALTEKWSLLQASRQNTEELERTVDLRTRELRASEHRFRTLSASAPIGIVEGDKMLNCTYVNPHWEKISGLSSREALGSGWRKVIHPDDLKRVTGEWRDALVNKRDFDSEHRYLRPDGEVRWVRARSVITRSEL